MEPSHNNKYIKIFITTGLLFLLSALFFGLAGALEYVVPGVWRNIFSFEKIRPLHVSSAVFWILTTAIGSVLCFLKEHNEQNIKNIKIIRLAFYIFTFSFVGILISYCFGILDRKSTRLNSSH